MSGPTAPDDRRTILDIGSNAGDFAVALAGRNPDHRVVAVEPVEALADGIRQRVREQRLGNVEVVQLAVDRTEGPAEINVAQFGDWGVSSLLSLDEVGIAADDYWSIREDLAYARRETIERVTLARLIEENGIGEVDFVKLDVQGLDLIALESAGPALPRIRGGMLEVPTSSRARLYAEEDQALEKAYAVLNRLGFEVSSVKPNDPACNEVNVYFVRRGEQLADIEADLSLRGIELYDGKHFWALPVATVDDLTAAEQLPGRVADLRAAASAEVRARRAAEQALTETTEALGLSRARETLLRRELARAKVGPGEAPAGQLAETRRLHDELRALRHRVDDLTQSTSWWVTGPMRRASDVVRRVRGRR